MRKAQNGGSKVLRRGGRGRGRKISSSPSRIKRALTVALALGAVAAIGTGVLLTSHPHVEATPTGVPAPAEVKDGVEATLLFTGVNSTTGLVRFDQSMTTYIRNLANAHAKVRVVGINGDGAVLIDQIQDLTPRLPNGEEIKVPKRAEAATADTVLALEDLMHTTPATAPGEGLALGMATLTITSPQLVIVSPGLDSQDPLDFQDLGWDVKPHEVAAAVAPEITSLEGTSVTFVVVPSAGAQQPLRPAQREYREDLWRALFKSAGAEEVNFLYPSGDAPPAGVPAGAPIDVPPPPSTPVPSTPETCVVDTSTYFRPNRAVLIDRAATRRALNACADAIGPDSTATVVGHTSGTNDNAFTKALSLARAQRVKELLVSLGVPAAHITTRGDSSRHQPYPNPSDVRNRAVIVTIHPEEGAKK